MVASSAPKSNGRRPLASLVDALESPRTCPVLHDFRVSSIEFAFDITTDGGCNKLVVGGDWPYWIVVGSSTDALLKIRLEVDSRGSITDISTSSGSVAGCFAGQELRECRRGYMMKMTRTSRMNSIAIVTPMIAPVDSFIAKMTK